VCKRIFGFVFLLVTFFSPFSEAQNYKETYRLQFHFSPEKNWMNDPNGLVYHDGEYHLFYQHNPFGNRWGHMSWGHAVSTGLIHWQHLPVALKEENGVMIFSGSAVVDKNNSSGFGSEQNSPLIAIYTGHHTETELQDQRIAYSLDNGRSWKKYEANPVLSARKDFRDPKVIWHEETGRWIMVVALSSEQKVQFYGSENLKDWNLLSEFGPAGAHDNILWECPDLFELSVEGNSNQTKWVLQVDVNPGGVAGGSGGQYFVGEFDGRQFNQDSGTEDQTRWVDYGRDFYAVQSYSDIPEEDGRRIWLAWMNNWDYAQEIPTKPWRSAMTIPRTVGLIETNNGYKLFQEPVKELQDLRTEHTDWKDLAISPANNEQLDFRGKAYEMIADFELEDAEEFGIKVRKGANEETVIGYNPNQQELFVDRRNSGAANFDSTFASLERALLAPENNRVKLNIFVDWSSVEVFGDGGKVVITDRIFPSSSSEDIELFSKDGSTKVVSLEIWKLKSIWNRSQN
jgi:fructan beta-fructosidase